MTVSFNTVPASGVLVPLFYAEMDNSQANTATSSQPTVIFGHALKDSVIPLNELILVSSPSELRQQAGAGSQLARMAAAYRNVDLGGQLWAIAIPEPEGTTATGTVTIGGKAIAAGVISLYIGKTRVQSVVAVGDTPTKIATAIVAAVNAVSDLPVTATVGDSSGSSVTLTAKHAGLCGNEIPLAVNYYGSAGSEILPNGVTVTIAAMSGGAGAPEFDDAFASLGDEDADFIAFPYNDSASLDAIGLAMNDSTGRWAPGRQSYGHVYSAKLGELAALQAFGTTRNDQHVTINGIEPVTQTCADEWAAAETARNAVFIRADPARPTQTGQLDGCLPAPAGKRFQKVQRNTLLNSGIATSYAKGSNAFIERAVTTYQTNKYGEKDNSYLDSETLHTSAYVLRALETCVTSKYGRHKLANDGTRYGPGQAIVTPSVIKAEMCAQYQIMEEAGIVENFELFKKYLVVERDANDPNRVNVLFPPDYVNQLRVFALVNQFRQQYQEAA
ncbi:TPA: phage tail sheath subtilisin-like domain-containing protein [Enterobacter roggenkampii]|nr:phage tail sheath subtilisin-like domain-containing protein [Enterobacter roggenkampii]